MKYIILVPEFSFFLLYFVSVVLLVFKTKGLAILRGVIVPCLVSKQADLITLRSVLELGLYVFP